MADVSTVALQRPVACSVSDEMASGMVGVGMGLEVGQSIAWIMVAFSWLAGSWDTNDTAAARSWSLWCANHIRRALTCRIETNHQFPRIHQQFPRSGYKTIFLQKEKRWLGEILMPINKI